MSNDYVDKVSAVGTIYDIHVPNSTIDRAMLDTDLQEKTDAVNDLKSAVGDIDDLQTSVKTDIVSAINTLVGQGDGLSETLKALLLELFQAAVYTSDKSSTIEALETALAIISWSQTGSTLTFKNVPEITSITQDTFTLTLI